MNREDYIDVTDIHRLYFKSTGKPLSYSDEIEVRIFDKTSGSMNTIILNVPDFLWGIHCAKIKEVK